MRPLTYATTLGLAVRGFFLRLWKLPPVMVPSSEMGWDEWEIKKSIGQFSVNNADHQSYPLRLGLRILTINFVVNNWSMLSIKIFLKINRACLLLTYFTATYSININVNTLVCLRDCSLTLNFQHYFQLITYLWTEFHNVTFEIWLNLRLIICVLCTCRSSKCVYKFQR